LHDLGSVRERQVVEEAMGKAGPIAKPSDKIGIADPAIRCDYFSPFCRQVVPAFASGW
jgi:hypothetical protein